MGFIRTPGRAHRGPASLIESSLIAIVILWVKVEMHWRLANPLVAENLIPQYQDNEDATW
ncbi:hypothetical protein [Thiohalophilus sp.]|uniref:hypothetical protein n=1 Tax=Thiohalophilus sp. TaxID=3028392 RepID=UPI00397619D9